MTILTHEDMLMSKKYSKCFVSELTVWLLCQTGHFFKDIHVIGVRKLWPCGISQVYIYIVRGGGEGGTGNCECKSLLLSIKIFLEIIIDLYYK